MSSLGQRLSSQIRNWGGAVRGDQGRNAALPANRHFAQTRRTIRSRRGVGLDGRLSGLPEGERGDRGTRGGRR